MNTIRGILILFCVLTIGAQSATACYAIAVGKDASADGSVLLGHDEQNGGNCIINFRRIPRRQFTTSDKITVKNGGKLPQVKETYSFHWSQNVNLEWSDGYMNEYGVSVTTNKCPSVEKNPSLTDGGIGYLLRRLVVERAKTAREGVHIAGDLLHTFGYAANSGRTMLIADPNEIWVLAIAPGKHWIAQKVPDDKAIAIPNIYIIREINLSDSANFLGSPDLIDYAKKKGWYTSGTFIFTNVYGVGYTDAEYKRQWNGQKALTEKVVPYGDPMPFAVKPDKKMTVADVIKILRDHDDGRTQEGNVFQLRQDLPPEIGCIYWRATAQPRYSGLLPWYAGMQQTLSSYCKNVSIEKQLTLPYQFNPPSGTFTNDTNFIWWDFKGIQDKVSGSSLGYKRARMIWDELEQRIYANQSVIEPILLNLYKTNKDSARKQITEYSNHVAYKASVLAKKMNANWIKNSNNTYCIALVTAAPVTVLEGQPVQFDAFGCSNSTISSYEWNFGDGTLGSKASPLHFYAIAGTYRVKVTLKDIDGKNASDSTTIVVKKNSTNNQPPFSPTKTGVSLKTQSTIQVETFLNSVLIHFTLNQSIAHAKIRINTISGRLVREIDLGSQRNGFICWKGFNMSGSLVSPGMYLIDIFGDGIKYDSKKAVLY